MSAEWRRWLPAVTLAAGCGFLLLSSQQKAVPLQAPLAELPRTFLGAVGRDIPISPEEQRIAGMSSYVLRSYAEGGGPAAFSVYVGYYETQNQGRSIHSPRNCLPGAGWEPLSHGSVTLSSASGPHRVNRYLLANGNATALVYYWYQGRGRVQASEYAVKWDLLRDKAIRGRSEEALVRVVVPIVNNDVAAADSTASQLGMWLVDEVQKHLPDFPGRTMAGG
jgi:EpsI family protein